MKKVSFNPKNLLIVLCAALFLLLVGLQFYTSTPAHIRNPQANHFHIRTQLIVDGKPVDFSEEKFQQVYSKDACSTELSDEPVHFHDGKDQMTHIHWDGVTGGELLKNYGWNFIGGKDDSFGRRYDQGFTNIKEVKTYANVLPAISEETNYFVYIGDEKGYQQKDWQDFLWQDLEEFFGVKSNQSPELRSTFNPFDWFVGKALAHAEVKDGHEEESEEQKLTRLNNLLGNVVIFAQSEEPTQKEISERFNNLEPLSDSTCGG